MRKHVQAFADSAVDAFGLKGPVFQFELPPREDCGGWASVRERFPQGGYVGFPCEEGAESDRLPFPDAAGQTVLCVDTLGHASEPRRAVGEMIRIPAPGVCSQAGAQERELPNDPVTTPCVVTGDATGRRAVPKA